MGGKGEMGRGAKGRGRKRDKRRGDFTDGYDEMPGWNEVTEFSDFVYPCNAGYPIQYIIIYIFSKIVYCYYDCISDESGPGY